MQSKISRREFIRNSAISGIGFVFLKNSKSAFSYAANEKLNIALVGVGGRGSWFVGAIPNLGQNVVAMCDVNEWKARPSFEKLPKARKFNDFRKMLSEMDKQIDAVVVAVPDHNHAVITVTAMKMGKHVFCEKPLTHNIYEARSLKQTAAKYKVASQMGNQGTASHAFRRAVELIQAGVIGDVRDVHAWNTGGGPGNRPLPKDVHKIPDYLHWDIWLGPASYRPYNSRWLNWHGWREFGTGQLGNWPCHTMNVIFKGLKLDLLWNTASSKDSEKPAEQFVEIMAEMSGIHTDTFPRREIVRYDFPARGKMPPVGINWYNGPGQATGPRLLIEKMMGRKLDWGDAGQKKWQDHAGCLLIGTKGMIHSNGHNTTFKLLPEDKFKDFEGPPQTLPRSRGHEREWLNACRGGPPAMSNFNYSTALTEFVLLGNIATLNSEKLKYDPVTMKIVDNSEANKAIRREYRDGWSL
jgi:predicted dehydrogenase